MSTFLLEIGTEELPADFAQSVLPQFKEIVIRDLAEKRLHHGLILMTSTPRRIVIQISDLPQKTDDFVDEVKGPPLSQAFKDGSPTQAAKGFARKYSLSLDDLLSKQTNKGEFLFAKICEKGVSSKSIFSDLVPAWILSLQGKRFMRWADGDIKFSRPIRWLLCLFDDEIIPVLLKGADPLVASNNLTRGHRLFDESVVIKSADSYFSDLRKNGVIAKRDERLKAIQSLVKHSSNEVNADPDINSELLNELVDLVETPSIIKGDFDVEFLELPPEVLSTVMKSHQRYIPLLLKNSSNDLLAVNAKETLIPSFLCISNGLINSNNVIKQGNERVLKARFSDAVFFLQSDLAIKSDCRRQKLDKVTFADGLGSLLDRVVRMQWLSKKLIEALEIENEDSENLITATYFCKHDLVSQIVGEFPELQGIMGGKYLLQEGESREVALSVLEQYLPRGAGDILPESRTGSLLAIVERLELLLSIFSKGDRPSGSSDPYALRRSANGIIQIIWNKELSLDLFNLIQSSTLHWQSLFPKFELNHSILLAQLSEFFRQRVISLLEDLGFDYDLIQAVVGETISIENVLVDVTDARRRVELLSRMRESGELRKIQTVVTRAARLADKSELKKDILSAKKVINISLFEEESEERILELINSLEPIVLSTMSDRYEKIASELQEGAEALSNFFDGENSVMVMTENKEVRRNRLNLLSVLRNQALIIADFKMIN